MLKKRKIFELFQQDKEFYKYYLDNIASTPKESKELWDRCFDKVAMEQKMDSVVALCMPPKTGNYTVCETFSKMNVTLCYVLKRGIHPFILLIYLK